MIQINLPEETKALIEGDIFKLDDQIDDTLLAKFLFYVPSIVREYGMAIAELRRQRRVLEGTLLSLQGALETREAFVLLDQDIAVYKNEALRNAGVCEDEAVVEIKKEIIDIKKKILEFESDIDELTEQYWSFKTLKDSLESITKLRVSEKTF